MEIENALKVVNERIHDLYILINKSKDHRKRQALEDLLFSNGEMLLFLESVQAPSLGSKLLIYELPQVVSYTI